MTTCRTCAVQGRDATGCAIFNDCETAHEPLGACPGWRGQGELDALYFELEGDPRWRIVAGMRRGEG